VKHRVAQRGVRLGERLINLEGHCRCRFRLREAFLRGQGFAHNEQGVGVRQAGVSRGVAGVEVNRLPEVLHTLFEPLGVALVPVIAPLQVCVIGLYVFGVTFRQTPLLLAGQPQP
jgi:hypothetical protein